MGSPYNIKLMNVDKFIKEHHCKEVTSEFIHESSSNTFAKGGLFDEEIFGQIASPNRLITHGYIDLHCRVFHPVIFQNLQTLKRFYIEIMSGKGFAIWDKEAKDFVRATEDEEGADTGFAFFLEHFEQIDFVKNNSLKRNDKVDVIRKYKNELFIDKILVMPAGIRDMKEEDGRIEKDSINGLYTSLLRCAKAMPKNCDMDPIFNITHYSIQRKVIEIYEYITNIVKGKRGFLEGKLARRNISGGTRNVISATNLDALSPDDPQYHRSDETKIPLYQAAKGYSSLVVHYLKSLFYNFVINTSADAIPMINPSNLKLEYVQIDDKDKDTMLTTEGIEKTIDRFRDTEIRFRPVGAKVKGNLFYLFLVYDDGKQIYLFRNLDEFKMSLEEAKKPFDMTKVRPITYIEMLYIATYHASFGKYGTVTRYPVTDEQSIYPCKTHLMSTTPAKVVTLVSDIKTGEGVMLPEYPMMNKKTVDVMFLHPLKLKGLGADFDGDTVSWIPVYSKEANEELQKYCSSVKNYSLASGAALALDDDLVRITVNALTMDTPELHKK